MKIIDSNLEFPILPSRADRDIYSLLSRKVLVYMGELGDAIEFVHQNFIDQNHEGIPYHYIIKSDGVIYSTRSRVYKNGMKFKYNNYFKNSIVVLTADSEAARTALVELLRMIVLQDNLLVTAITSEEFILTGADPFLKSVRKLVSESVSKDDPLRTISDDNPNASFFKIVSNEKINSIAVIRNYTNVPEQVINTMNPHLAEYVYKPIPSGITIFLPSNKMSDFLSKITDQAMVSFIFTKVENILGGELNGK